MSKEKKIEQYHSVQDRMESFKATYPAIVSKGLFEIDIEEAEQDIVDSIGRKFKRVVEEGYSSIYSGEQISKVIKEHQKRIVFQFVDEITEIMTYSLFSKLKKREDKLPFNFYGFFYIALASTNNEILRKSLLNAFSQGEEDINIVSSKIPLEDLTKKILSKNKDTNGVDIFSQIFFDFFREKRQRREATNPPYPEEIISLKKEGKV